MLNRLLKLPWFPHLAQIITFVMLIALIAIGWSISSDDSTFLLTLRNTNLANLIIWCFWWPGIIVASVLFGRLWCMVCPMELLATVLNRIGLKWKAPKALRSGWGITILYGLVLVFGVHTLAIHRVPHRLAIYMLMLLGMSVLVSLIFEKRAFCSYLCPIGSLLGLYSFNAAMEWRVRDRSVCTECNEKPCINRKRKNVWYGRPCQSDLFPGNLSDNIDCILCTQCMKACPNENVHFAPRKPFSDLLQPVKLKASQYGLLFIVFGFAFYEVVTEWKTGESLLLALPNYLVSSLNISAPFDKTFTAVVLFIIAPLVLISIIYLIHSILFRRKSNLSSFFMVFSAFIPLLAGTHVAKSIVKSLSRLQYVPGAIDDPTGIQTAGALVQGSMTIGGQWQVTINHLAQGTGIAFLGVGFAATMYLLSKNMYVRDIPGKIVLSLVAAGYFICTAGALTAKLFF